MIPVYFPFTHISEPLADALCRCFGGLVVYRVVETRPHNQEEPSGAGPAVDIRSPIRDDDHRLIRLYHEYRRWGQFHEGGLTALKNRFDGAYDAESFVTQIRSEIFGRHSRETDAPDPVFASRLFLLAAQDYDLASETIDHAMADSDIRMAQMVSELSGALPPADAGDICAVKEDSGAMMTEARLLSWYRLASLDPGVDLSFLVTTSPAVCQSLMEHEPLGRLVGSWGGIPCPGDDRQRASWAAWLAEAARMGPDRAEPPPGPDIAVKQEDFFIFKLFLFARLTPEQLLTIGPQKEGASHAIQPGIGNIMVGLLETRDS